MRKHRIWYTVAVIASMILYLVANRPEMLMFLCVLVVVPFFLVLVEVLALRGITWKVSAPSSCRIGQKVRLTVDVTRKNRLPLGNICIYGVRKNILFRDSSEIRLDLQPREKKEQSCQYLVEMKNCGSVHLMLERMECMDLLGLFRWKIPMQEELDILVYPAQMNLQAKITRRPESVDSGELYDQNRKGMDVSEVAGLRDYVPGDSLGSIHWKLSGKLDNLVVREFGYPSNYQVLILVDILKKVDGRELSNDRNNAVLALTVELSRQMMELHIEHNVGRIVNGEYLTMPVYSQGTQEEMTTNLLCRPITEQAGSSDTMYYFLQKELRQRYTKLIYITPAYEESTVRQVAGGLDLTVIQTVEKAETAYADAAGYAVIAVNEKEYQNKIYNIMI